MSQKSQTHRDNVPILASETSFQRNRTKSALNLAISSTPNQPEKQTQRQSMNEARPAGSKNTARNFNFSFNTAKDAGKKNYMKNSDKTIKPPEKPLKATKPAPTKPVMLREKTAILLSRTNSNVKGLGQGQSQSHGGGMGTRLIGKRSLTFNNLNTSSSTTPPCARVDIRAIEELAKRLEHLQGIFMNKLELFHSREPNTCKKAYKLVAMVVGDEARLLVGEHDAQRLPSSIPARSAEDLHIKINKFFTGCLIAFTDKLRQYQSEDRPIDTDEIYKELKRDEHIFCAILKDWVFEMCDEADATLIAEPTVPPSPKKDLKDCGIQPEFDQLYQCDMPEKDYIDLISTRVELNELKLQLSRKNESHALEVSKLKEKFETKFNDMEKSLLIEQAMSSAKDDKIKKVQDLNESLTQQLDETNELLDTLRKRNDELNAKLQSETDLTFELKKLREEFDNMRKENTDLHEMKTRFLRKLNQRATRIDLLEKEIKQQNRKMDVQNKEIEELKLEFEAKVKENREYKESMDARNQLIDHLRKAVDIEQRKRKELEENVKNEEKVKPFSNGIKFNETLTNEQKPFMKHGGEPWRRNFNENSAAMNFTETMPIHVKAPLSKLPKDKNANNQLPNSLDLNLSKDSSDMSSNDEMIAVKERFQPRKARTIAVKKRF